MALAIISIDGLAASNYISNIGPQWEDSPFQQRISDCAANELLPVMHRLLLAALQATGEENLFVYGHFFNSPPHLESKT